MKIHYILNRLQEMDKPTLTYGDLHGDAPLFWNTLLLDQVVSYPLPSRPVRSFLFSQRHFVNSTTASTGTVTLPPISPSLVVAPSDKEHTFPNIDATITPYLTQHPKHILLSCKFSALQTQESITPNDMFELIELLEQSELHVNTSFALRLLGDEVADRGKICIAMLALINELYNRGMQFKINFSNHAALFTFCYLASPKDADGNVTWLTVEEFKEQSILFRQFPSQYRSLYNTLACIEQDKSGKLGRFTQEVFEKIFIPNYRIIDYGHLDSNKQFNLYTHAPIGKKILLLTYSDLPPKYKTISSAIVAFRTPQNARRAIDDINRYFREKVLCDKNKFCELFTDIVTSQQLPHMRSIVDNRFSGVSQQHIKYFGDTELFDYIKHNVHGHDSKELTYWQNSRTPQLPPTQHNFQEHHISLNSLPWDVTQIPALSSPVHTPKKSVSNTQP